jgi:hypothetical protein
VGTGLSAVVFGQHIHLIIFSGFFWRTKFTTVTPRKEEELKENIRWEIANIPAEQLTTSAGARNVCL